MSQQSLQPQGSNQLQNSAQSQQATGSPQQMQGGFGTGQSAQPQRGEFFPTRNYLSPDVRAASVASLNQCLADLTAVVMQCKTAHWNVRGPEFYQLHELFEDVAEALEPFVDDVAERATALGGQAQGTPPVVARQANIPQLSPTTSTDRQLLQSIATSLATLDATLYDQINRVSQQGDLDTADLFNEVSREVSKTLWFVEAHLQGPTTGQQQTGGWTQAAGTQ